MKKRTDPKPERARGDVPIKEKAIASALGLAFCVVFLEVGLRVLGAAVMFAQEHVNRSAFDKTGAYRIMCLGESTTADLGDGRYSYPRQLAQILTERGRGRRFSVINKGIPSGDTSLILAELEGNLDMYRPDMVIAMQGINDTHAMRSFDETRGKNPYRFGDIFKTFKLAGLLSKDLERKKTTEYFLKAGAYIDPWHGTKWKAEAMAAWAAAAGLYNSAWMQKQSGQYASAEEKYKTLLKTHPNCMMCYIGLGECYRKQGKYQDAEELYREIIREKMNEKSVATDLPSLETIQFGGMPYERDREAFGDAVKNNRYQLQAMVMHELGRWYTEERKYKEAADVYEALVGISPDSAYMGLSKIRAAQGQYQQSQEFHKKAEESRAQYYAPPTVTWKNYRKLMGILDARGIRFVAVQYPQRSIEPLQKIIGGKKGVILVDNEAVFRKALERGSYDRYFVDRCYIDYGHATKEGNRILAENIANVLLAEVFNKQPGPSQ